MLGPFRGGAGCAEPAARHHGDAIAEREELGEIAADDEDGFCAAEAARYRRFGFEAGSPDTKLVEQLVDLRFAGDVDAAGRLIEDEDINVVVKQPRESDLLLIAA